MKSKSVLTLGVLSVMASAVIFGFTPVLAALSYRGGNNGANMAFLRALLPIPILYGLACRKPAPTPAQRRRGIVLGLLLFGCTLLLYSSYAYIPVGLATTLHFLYPLYVALYEAVFQGKPLGKWRTFGLILGVSGAALFLDLGGEAAHPLGLLMAVASGFCYAAYIIVLGRESTDPMPLYRLMLEVSVAGTVLCGGFGLVTKQLTVALTGAAWITAGAAALLVSIVGCVLFQLGVRSVGKANASIFSLLEPMTSIAFSALLLGDRLSAVKIVGCCLILMGLFVAGQADRMHAQTDIQHRIDWNLMGLHKNHRT